MLMITPLFACDNGGNNDESNNPPPETPKQTNFYEEKLTIYNPKFYCYEQFDNIEDATAYAKTWRKDYEIFIPDIEEAGSLRIDFITYQSREEKETFLHKIEFEYTNAEPYYLLAGETTVYKEGELDKKEFYLETRELAEGPNLKTNYQYFYNEDGSIGSTYDLVNYMVASVAIKQNNFVLLHAGLSINKTETKTPEEIKALVLDNIVPVEEQKYKDKEISTDYVLGVEVPITGPKYSVILHEDFGVNNSINKDLNKYFDSFCFSVKADEFNNETYSTRYEFYPWHYSLCSFSTTYEFVVLQTDNKIANISITTRIIPISLLNEEDNKTYEYSLEVTEQLENGYRIQVKNGFANIFFGTITAEDKTDINLEEIEHKILDNIELIKGE